MTTRTVLRAAAVECAWTALHAATYPLGLAQEKVRPIPDVLRLDALAPHQRALALADPGAAGVPILLLHGVVDNRTVFTRLRRRLHRTGFAHIRTMNYTPLLADVRTAARRLGDRVEQICAETGHEQIHIVGHSLGGVIARYYVQCLGGDARVGTVISLGAPHRGTVLARALPALVLRQLRPGSALLAELDAPVGCCASRFVNVWSHHDQMVLPHQNAQLSHPDLQVRDVALDHVGHMSLTVDRRVLDVVVDELRRAPVGAGSMEQLLTRGQPSSHLLAGLQPW